MVQHDAGLPVTGVIDDPTLQLRDQSNPCLSASSAGRLGIQLVGEVSCDEALAVWAEAVQRPGGTTPSIPVGEWSCTLGSDSPAFKPAIAGSCAGPTASFQVVAGWN
jgi:hypothetical protein